MEDVFHVYFYLLTTILYFITASYAAPSTLHPTTVKVCLTRPYVKMWEKEYYPNPQTDIGEDYCGKGCKRSWICDPGNLITSDQADTLDQKIEETRMSNVCGCSTCRQGIDGYTIVVALIPDIKVEVGDSVQETATEFITYLRNTTWRFGSCSNDVLILLTSHQNFVVILAGDTVKETLTKDCLIKIQTEANKRLSKNNIYNVLDYLITKFGHALKNKTCEPQNPTYSKKKHISLHLLLIIIGVVLLILVMLMAVFLKRQGKCQNLRTYRINIPSITIRVKKPHKHHHKKNQEEKQDTGDEEVPMKHPDSKETEEIDLE